MDACRPQRGVCRDARSIRLVNSDNSGAAFGVLDKHFILHLALTLDPRSICSRNNALELLIVNRGIPSGSESSLELFFVNGTLKEVLLFSLTHREHAEAGFEDCAL